MNATLQTILYQWTGQKHLDMIETDHLVALSTQYPMNPSLHLLLAKKYAAIASPLYAVQIQRAASYFPSTLQLHQWLANEEEMANSAPVDEKLSSLLSDQVAQFNESVETEKLEFEKEAPQMVKDYFAAQGIELDLSKLPQDKFTTQLRSFTAWLKVLKHQAENEPNLAEIGEEQEKMITLIAEKANNATDVLTEAMAEIWEKQGNKRKAIDIYSKLSFIFPEKSVYFASRIEQLKQKNS
ncbi:MAG: hypothetical protein RLZ56_1238 [Bacteroidota bacterium]|jgi:hypothetical protein